MEVSKDHAVAMLRNLGYTAALESGVVVIYIGNEEILKPNVKKQYQKVMEQIGYRASWGLKPIGTMPE